MEVNKLSRETARIFGQLHNLIRFGRLNPFPQTTPSNLPPVLRKQKELRINSPLEYVLTHFERRHHEFYFVQVGAYDGVRSDSLVALAMKYGWTGILVEPQPMAVAELRKLVAQHPKLHVEQAAIADSPGTRFLFTNSNETTNLASFDRHHLVRRGVPASHIKSIDVPVITVTGLIEKYDFPELNFIQIDAEGYDAEIIRSLDFRRIDPDVIRYEHRNLLQRDRSFVIDILAECGYRFLVEDKDTIAVKQR